MGKMGLLEKYISGNQNTVIVIDKQGTVKQCDQNVKSIFGYQEDELVGKNVAVLMPKNHADSHDSYIQNYLKTKVPKILGMNISDIQCRRKDGTFFSANLHVTEEENEGESEFVGRVHNIEGVKKMESALRLIKDSTFSYFGDDLFRHVAQKSCEHFGLDYAFIGTLQKGDKSLKVDAAAGSEGVMESFEYTIKGSPCEYVLSHSPCFYPDEIQLLFPEDEHLKKMNAIGFIGVSLKNRDGEVIGLIAGVSKSKIDNPELYTDTLSILAERISYEMERNKTIDELSRMRQEAEASSESKGRFLATMSHEIRTPMNGVVGMIDFLMDSDLNIEQMDYLQTIQESCRSLMGILNDILDLSKIESGKVKLENVPFDVQRMIDDVLRLFSFRLRDMGVTLNSYVTREIHSVVLGDPGKVRQILTNLLSNAVKFTTKGQVQVNVSALSENEEEQTLHFEISDTGIGIPAEKLKGLFEPFAQADKSTARKYGGTGLGLSISKQLAELMGGHMGAQSEPGEGSTFWFELSFKKGKEVDLDQEQIDCSSKKVLAVDNNKIFQLFYTRFLRNMGCTFDCVDSASTALDRLREQVAEEQPYDLVLTAQHMPDMDGVELSAAIKEDAKLKRTAIVMLTSGGVRGDADKVKDLGLGAYLTKPFTESMFTETLMKVFERQSSKGSEATELITRYNLESNRQNLKVLVVDDNRVNVKVAGVLLKKMGHFYDTATNGREAVEKYENNNYDLILMDVEMPEMDGIEATKIIRSSKRDNRDIPILAFTASVLPEEKKRCQEAGMNDFLAKPIQPHLLVESISKHTERATAES